MVSIITLDGPAVLRHVTSGPDRPRARVDILGDLVGVSII